MARKRSANPAPEAKALAPAEAPAKVQGRPRAATPKPALPIVLTVRGRDEYLGWLEGLADKLARSIGVAKVERTLVYDKAMADLARALGHPEPPSRY